METTAQALCIVNEIHDPNFGINLDIGHSLTAAENVEDQLSPNLSGFWALHERPPEV